MKSNARNNTNFKTQTCLISLSISLILSGVAMGNAPSGMQFTYSLDSSCNSPSNPNIAASVGSQQSITLAPGSTIYGTGGSRGQSLCPDATAGDCTGNNLIISFETAASGTSVCPYEGVTSLEPHYESGAIQVYKSDFYNNSSVIAVKGSCDANNNLSSFTCTASGFNGGGNNKPGSDGNIDVFPISDTTVYLGQTYPLKTSPIMALGDYFIDGNPNQAYKGIDANGTPDLNNRTYYSVTVGTGAKAVSITSSKNQLYGLSNIIMGPNNQSITGGASDYRTQIYTIGNYAIGDQANQYQTACEPAIADSSTYKCQVTVCACDPGITDPTKQGGCLPNQVNTTNDAGVVDNFTCPLGTPTPGVSNPVSTTFNLYIQGPQLLASSVQDLALKNTAATGSSFDTNALSRFVIPINPTQTPTMDIPLDQYFEMSDSSSIAGISYSIVGINNTPLSSATNIPNGYNGNPFTQAPSTPSSTPLPEPVLNTSNATNDWSPIKINYEQEGTPVTQGLSINNNNLEIATGNLTGLNLQGSLYQVTIEATLNSQVAYQTIYLNISTANTSQYTSTGTEYSTPAALSYTPMKPFNSAWMYLPGYYNSKDQSNPSGGSTITGSVCDSTMSETSDPCLLDSNLLKSLDQAGTPIQALTPDIVWLAFYKSGKAYPTGNTTPIDNNFYTNSTNNIQNVVSYFKIHNPNTQMILTAEMDGPVMSALDSLQDTIPPGDTTDAYTQMDQLVWATALPFTQPFTYKNATGATGTYSLDGLQFDIEPFKSSAKAVEFYKRVADILARHGKPLAVFAFPYATIPTDPVSQKSIPSVAMALGPLGIVLPSMYDIGQNTDPQYLVSTTPTAHTYQTNFMPGTSPNFMIDNNCHWSASWAYSYLSPNPADLASTYQLPIQSYCNINLNNTLFNDSVFMGLPLPDSKIVPHAGKTNPPFIQVMNTFGSHFQMALPSSGSAENYTAQIIYNPTCVANNETPTGNQENQVISDITTLVANGLINLDPYLNTPLSDGISCPTNAPSANTNMVETIPALPSNFTYGGLLPGDIQSAFSTSSNPANTDTLNAIMPLLLKDLSPKTYYIGDDAYCEAHNTGIVSPTTKAQACRYIAYLSNPNNEGGYTQTAYVPNGGSTPSQDTYVNAITDLAQGKNTEYPQTSTTNMIGTPQSNPSNLGLALYSIATEDVIGCFTGESHAFKQNCFLALPITTPLYDPSGEASFSANHSATISGLTVSNFSPTGYTLSWTLNCTTQPSNMASLTSAYAGNSPNPQYVMTGGTGSSNTCGSTQSATFSRAKNLSSGTVSLTVVNSNTLLPITNTLYTTLGAAGPSLTPNPVWNSVYQYTQSNKISNLNVSNVNSTGYTLSWTLNCTTPPSNMASLTSAYAGNSTNPQYMMTGGASPASCGPQSASFKGANNLKSGTVMLTVVNGNTLLPITNTLTASLSIPSS